LRLRPSQPKIGSRSDHCRTDAWECGLIQGLIGRGIHENLYTAQFTNAPKTVPNKNSKIKRTSIGMVRIQFMGSFQWSVVSLQ
jgi:hypothetical protein